jgi:hypothetical protein
MAAEFECRAGRECKGDESRPNRFNFGTIAVIASGPRLAMRQQGRETAHSPRIWRRWLEVSPLIAT